MYEIIGRITDSPKEDPRLFRFTAVIAEYDPDYSGVRFTLPESSGISDVLLPNVGKERSEDIIRRGRNEVLDLSEEGVLCYVDDYDADDWNMGGDVTSENGDGSDKKPGIFRRLIGTNKKAARKRLFFAAIAALLVLLIVPFVIPVWYVQIQGDSEPYDLFVLVYDDPDDNIAPRAIDWSILPHYPEKVKVEGFSEELNATYTWNPKSGRYPLFWEEIDHELDSDVQGTVPLMLMGYSDYPLFPFPDDFRAFEAVVVNGIPHYRHESLQYSGKFAALSGYSNDNTLYGGVQVYIGSKWLNEKYSLATVFWNLVSGTHIEAEKISAVSLTQK